MGRHDQRLKDFDVGAIPQLKTVRTQIGKRMKRLSASMMTKAQQLFFASDLTREHLRGRAVFCPFARQQLRRALSASAQARSTHSSSL